MEVEKPEDRLLTLGETETKRHLLFVSHANPDDNDFARWLSLQLAQHGYDVWCDVADLIGGEDFWRDIEATIRDRTAKFLFVLSRSSNIKPGTLSELSVAKITAGRTQLKDFIVPLRIDDIPHGDMNIELARLNAISFNPNWASGFSKLLEKLDEDAVARNPDRPLTAVASWWRKHFSPHEGVTVEEEEYASNWFEIDPRPEELFFHEIARSGPGAVLPRLEFAYPVVPHSRFLISFAEAALLRSELSAPHEIARTIAVSFDEFASDAETVANIARRERRTIIVGLLRQSWELLIAKQEVLSYELASRRTSIFYSHPKEKAVRMPFRGVNGGIGFRALTGYRTVLGATPESKRKRYWHFAISVKPMTYPVLGFAVYYHVLFSDDGHAPWASKDRMHAARRRQCWDWWNDDWRDRILAFLASLSPCNDNLELPAGEANLSMSLGPRLFSSPLSYRSSGKPALLGDRQEEPEAKQEIEEREEELEEIEDEDLF